ncbi:hypothetical protein DPMN_193509 [Dreissena polymorpha]|uniref:Uncharacterized protein n=1 Tax=Dreissena polymorpha TaxID=45954 RepID=A0A9D3XXE7_DREPO|nr:hypothetical protein DPMN_193509 [Dreissena polymorpha]
MINLTPSSSRTESLRHFSDTFQKHLPSLDILLENTNQSIFVLMIKYKLPRDTLLQLEIQKGPEKSWTEKELLRTYIVANERAEQEKDTNTGKATFSKSVEQFRSRVPKINPKKVFETETRSSRYLTTAQALVSADKIAQSNNNFWTTADIVQTVIGVTSVQGSKQLRSDNKF